MVLSGDALLVGDAGRPDLHAHGDRSVEEMARVLYRSLTERLLALPGHLPMYPAHYSARFVVAGSRRTPRRPLGSSGAITARSSSTARRLLSRH